MTKKMSKAALLFFAGAMALTSCNRETDLYNPYATMEDYSNNWNDKFGNVDENQDWNMSEKVTATFNLSEITNDECSVNIYSKSPLKEGCILLASTTVKGNGSISFDMAESEGLVYVKIDNAHGNIISGYYDVVERTITVGKPATRATGDCNTTQGDILAIEHDPYQDPNDPSIWLNKKTEFIQLNNVTTSAGETWMVSDVRDIVGGVFAEGANNVEKWTGVLEDNVIYTMAEDGGITLDLNYRNTSGNNKFGYFYYTGELPDIATVNKYILIDKPCDGNNSYVQFSEYKVEDVYDNIYDTDGNWIAWDKVGIKETYGNWTSFNGQQYNVLSMTDKTLVKGTKFELAYFGADGKGTASYTFPKGTKVAFFVIQDNGYAGNNKIYYSIADLNKDGVFASTYNYGGTTFLGFEDFSDKDLNDILFFASGNFEKPEEIGPDPVEPEQGESWIVACEDLGSTDDYDFNDIVFSVSHVGGSKTATVTPLAAGGTIPAYIYYDSKNLGEIHQLIKDGANTSEMLNTTSKGSAGKPFTVDVPEDFTMSEGMGGFSIMVQSDNAITITSPALGTAPQMICMPGSWAWPKERVGIEVAYPSFSNWSQNSQSNLDWYKSPVSEYIVK